MKFKYVICVKGKSRPTFIDDGEKHIVWFDTFEEAESIALRSIGDLLNIAEVYPDETYEIIY